MTQLNLRDLCCLRCRADSELCVVGSLLVGSSIGFATGTFAFIIILISFLFIYLFVCLFLNILLIYSYTRFFL